MIIDCDCMTTPCGCSVRWISVKDKLPDKDGVYLVWQSDDFVHNVSVTTCHNKIWFCHGKVTHWMPLPEAPEGGSN